jgi:hypothetical protein
LDVFGGGLEFYAGNRGSFFCFCNRFSAVGHTLLPALAVDGTSIVHRVAFLFKGSRKNKIATLGVEAPAWQNAKTQEYPDIMSFRNVARRDASASKM